MAEDYGANYFAALAGDLPGFPKQLSYVPGSVFWHSAPCVRAFGVSALNELRVAPIYIPRTMTFDMGGIYVQGAVATALLRACIYSDANNYPAALLYDSGQKDVSVVGGVTWALTQTLAPGIYWVGGVGQTAAPNLVLAASSFLTVPAATTAAFFPGNAWAGYVAGGQSGACPATFPAVAGAGLTNPPLFCLRNVAFTA